MLLQGIESLQEIESLYTYQHIATENNRLLLANKYKERIILEVGMAFLATILFFGYIWKRMKEQREHATRLTHLKRQEYQERVAEYNREIDLLNQQLARLSDTHEPEKEVVKEKLDRTVEQKNRMIASREEAEALLRASTIYRHVHCISRNVKVEMTEEHWHELQKEIDKAHNDFTARLYLLYPRLKQKELRVCLLVKARVTNSDMAAILCVGSNSISSIRARLFEKIHGRKGKTKDFDNFIWEL